MTESDILIVHFIDNEHLQGNDFFVCFFPSTLALLETLYCMGMRHVSAYLSHTHLIGGEGTRFVRAND